MRARLLFAFLVAAWSAPTELSAAPRFEALAGGAYALVGLPNLLAEDDIAGQLETGLTTTFAFEASRTGRAVGGARLEVRYDLWDEVFRVRLRGADGRREQHDLGGREALATWWRQVRLTVLPAAAAGPGDEVRLRLDIIPFSQAEGRDTQRWFSDALGGADATLDSDAVPGVDEVLGVLIATSIRRRALRTVRWSLTVPAASPRGRP